MNLKEILMLLGNKLVERGFAPAADSSLRRMRAEHRLRHCDSALRYREIDTRPERPSGGLELIVLLTEWLNACPEAQDVLAEIGVEWPMVQQSERPRVRSGWLTPPKAWIQLAANTACRAVTMAVGSMLAEDDRILAANIRAMRATLLNAFDMLASADAALEGPEPPPEG